MVRFIAENKIQNIEELKVLPIFPTATQSPSLKKQISIYKKK